MEPNRIDYPTIGLRELILNAYGVLYDQIVPPPWMGQATFFHVIVTFPVGTTKEQLQLMWRDLLTERFGLRAHRETKTMPVYAMVISPRGLRIKPAEKSDDSTVSNEGLKMEMTPTEFHIKENKPVSVIRDAFGGYLDLPLLDMTGLSGDYSIDLSVPRDRQMPDPDLPFSQYTTEILSGITGWSTPAFRDAAEKQLGIKIEQRSMPREMIVIDSLNKLPTPN